MIPTDRVGIGWRPELAAGILANLDAIGAVEVILDDLLSAGEDRLPALRTLASQVPVLYHGVGLGLASSHPVEQPRLDRLARTLDRLAIPAWSEHLSFVRAGGHEIGHLAAPPRTEATVEGALANLARARLATGRLPAMENIATLIDPPGSTLAEPAWTEAILSGSGCGLLLDLHNLYANAVNAGADPIAFLRAFPLHRVDQVHLSGGMWIDEPAGCSDRPAGRRLLDDHVHDVPDIVFGLLEAVAAETLRPLTVILERDGEYPEFGALLEQLRRAREALARGRAQGGFSDREATVERAGF